MGTPCSGFSIAATTRTTTDASELSRSCALFSLRVIRLCQRMGVFWSLENPQSSSRFSWTPIQKLERRPGVFRVLYHNCRYGTPWLKPTVVLTNLEPPFGLSRLCQCRTPHLHLRGKVSSGGRQVWLTKLAGAYPPSLCRAWARILANAIPAFAGTRHGVLSAHWENQLARAVGGASQQVAAATCPARCRLPFSKCSPRWGTSW